MRRFSPGSYHRCPAVLRRYRRDRENPVVPNPLFSRRMVGMGDKPEVGRLVRASADGDEAAWNELVRRFAPRVMAVIRSYRLAPADAEDVCQTVWLRLVEHLDGLRDPEALPGWLRSTTMHECIRQMERKRRTVPVDPQSDEAVNQPSTDDIEAAAQRAELRQALRDGDRKS